jgi:hypothetical protein
MPDSTTTTTFTNIPPPPAAALTYGQTTCAPYGVTFSATVTTPPTTAESEIATPTTMAPAGTVTSTINPTDAAMGVSATGSASWTASWPIAPPTGNVTATLLSYTGAAASSVVYEIAMVLAGAAGMAAFLV